MSHNIVLVLIRKLMICDTSSVRNKTILVQHLERKTDACVEVK